MSSTGKLSIRGSAATAAAPRLPLDRRLRRLFAVNATMGGCAALAAGVAIAGSLASVRIGGSSRAGGMAILGLHFTRPYLNAAALLTLALALAGLGVVALAVRAAAIELLANRRFLRALAGCDPQRCQDYFVFDQAAVQAFCAGLFRPQVYVSTGAIRTLSAPQLQVVLAHERHHRRSRDPLRVAVGRILARALFFTSIVGRIHDRCCTMAELAADEAAIATHQQGTSLLASALLAFAAGPQPATAVGIAPERVDQMVGRGPTWPLPLGVVAFACAASALTAVAAWQVARLALIQTTLNLPLVSAQPCIVVLALIPAAVLAARAFWRHGA